MSAAYEIAGQCNDQKIARSVMRFYALLWRAYCGIGNLGRAGEALNVAKAVREKARAL
jgi:hypothetical protein